LTWNNEVVECLDAPQVQLVAASAIFTTTILEFRLRMRVNVATSA
jgi:hypothetical protein